jgi:hypothetical protein
MRSKTSSTMDPLLYANEQSMSPTDQLHGFTTDKYDPGIARNRLTGEEGLAASNLHSAQLRQMALPLPIAPLLFGHRLHCSSRVLKHERG